MLLAVSKKKESWGVNTAIHNPKFQMELGFEFLSYSQISRTLQRFDSAILEDFFLPTCPYSPGRGVFPIAEGIPH